MAGIEDRRKQKGGYTGPKPWRVRYRTPDRDDRVESFRTQEAAKNFARSVEVDQDRGEWVDPRLGEKLFGDCETGYAAEWLSTKADVRARTLINIKGRIK